MSELERELTARGIQIIELGPEERAADEECPDPDRAAVLRHNRKVWKEMLQANVDDEEWHGVMDAAADLREIDAELRGLGVP